MSSLPAACPHCPHCKGDYTGQQDVEHGRRAGLIKVSPTLQKLRAVAGLVTFDKILRWIEAQAGTRGRREQAFVFVTDDGALSQVYAPHPPEVIFSLRDRRRA